MKRFFLHISLVAGSMVACCSSLSAQDPAGQNLPPGEATNGTIREVLSRVVGHHLHPVVDGEYPPAASLEEAQAAKAPTGIHWFYPEGVMYYGLLAAGDILGNPAAGRFVLQHNRVAARDGAWLLTLQKNLPASPQRDTFIRRSPAGSIVTLGNLDSCGAMGMEILEAQRRYPEPAEPAEPAVDQVSERIADWIIHRQDRLPGGVLCRFSRLNGTVWPDDLYMACPFLVRWSQHTGQTQYLDDAARQILGQAALQQDRDGLWFHGYAITAGKAFPWKWGRANGWAAMACAEVLSSLPADHPSRGALLTVLRRQIEGLKPLQTPDGRWRQVLDQPGLWEETSCTAMFAFSIARAVNRGWIEPSNLAVARRAFAGVCGQIDAQGNIGGTCLGTDINAELSYYAQRRRPPDDLHGVGPVLLAGAEILAAK